MPIAIVFAAGDLDYIDKLNQLIAQFNATTTGGTFESIAVTGDAELGTDGADTITVNGALHALGALLASGGLTADTIKTSSGTTPTVHDTVTTLFNPGTARGLYKVSACVVGAGAVNYTASAEIAYDGTGADLKEVHNGAALELSLAGTVVKGKQTSGGPADIDWAYTRLL